MLDPSQDLKGAMHKNQSTTYSDRASLEGQLSSVSFR